MSRDSRTLMQERGRQGAMMVTRLFSLVGLAIRVASGSYIDLGAKYSLTGPGSFFFQREQWVTPYLGMLFR